MSPRAFGPPTVDRLLRTATAYLARRAASTVRVRTLLARRIARTADADESPDAAQVAALIDPVIARLEKAGLLDDAAFARQRAARLAEKGRPAGMIRAELRHRHGLPLDDPGLADTLSALDPTAQAQRWAERRRLGPFRLRDRALKRDADIASLVRAGFSVRIAKAVVDGAAADGDVELR